MQAKRTLRPGRDTSPAFEQLRGVPLYAFPTRCTTPTVLGAPQVQEVDPEDMSEAEEEDAAARDMAPRAEAHTGDEWSEDKLSGADDGGVMGSDEDLQEWDADELGNAGRSGADDEAASEADLEEWEGGGGGAGSGAVLEERDAHAAAMEDEGPSEAGDEDAANGDPDGEAEEWGEDAATGKDGEGQSEEESDEYGSDSDGDSAQDYWRELAGRQGHVPTEVKPCVGHALHALLPISALDVAPAFSCFLWKAWSVEARRS